MELLPIRELNFKIVGVNALILNNPQVISPFNKYTLLLKPLTAKRKKTEEDMNQIFKLQFESSLYMKGDSYIIPGDHFWKSVCTAAKEQKLGKKFEQSFHVTGDCILDFPEKKMTPDELFDEGSHVDVRSGVIGGRSRVPVCRAIFNEWETIVSCYYDNTQLDEKDIEQIFKIAGKRYGVGTYRKIYGRFDVEKL